MLKPGLVVECGTRFGGSALFFANVMRGIGQRFAVLSVDIDHSQVSQYTMRDPDITLLTMSSTDPRVPDAIRELRMEYPGPIFAILDSDHSKDHVLGELKMLRSVMRCGDYLIVEDSNINGHPVAPAWGLGPYEAIEEYFQLFPHDYTRDADREEKFGFTFAPHGFLVRN